ncbi:MAG: DUF2339 domain-containing protein [Rhodobacteraceae bacterium]|nr:DUF2339 domain-containing protein [Paracoccaceae bacterium]
MGFIFGLLGLATFFFILGAPFYLISRVKELEARIKGLEQKLARGAVVEEPQQVPERPAAEEPQAVEPETPEPAQAAPETAPTAKPAAARNPWEVKDTANRPPLPVTRAEAPGQDQPLVFRTDRVAELFAWVVQNWIYVVSAVSLGLAGSFLVQYGMEHGWIPPLARVILGLMAGAALVGAGEWIRRHGGDEPEAATAYLPSTFAGAGIATLFAVILLAHQLYGLIGPGTSFAGLVVVAVLAVGLGWVYGAFLTAIGLAGATAAPFMVSSDTESVYWLYGYFGVIGIAGLAVDAGRRWAWISVLSLGLAYGAGWLLFLGEEGAGYYTLMTVVLAFAATTIPVLSLTPRHEGARVSGFVFLAKAGDAWPTFPVRLSFGAVAVASGLIFALEAETAAEGWLMLALLAVLILAFTLWAADAPALGDIALLPSAAFAGVVLVEAVERGPIYRAFRAGLERLPETRPPMDVTVLVALAALISIAAAWRSQREGAMRLFYALGAVSFAPGLIVGLELFWEPADVLGTWFWTGHVLALAVMTTIFAERFAKAAPEDHGRPALAALATLSLLALALFLLLSQAALTVALAVLVVVAAALDRRFDLFYLGLYIQIGIAVLGYRLVIDPGFFWANEAPIWDVILSYGGAVVALAAAREMLRSRPRPVTDSLLETGVFGFGGIFASVMLYRAIDAAAGLSGTESHWAISLQGTIWLCVMLVQVVRYGMGGVLRWIRMTLAVIAGLVALAFYLGGLVMLSPLFSTYEPVLGPPVFNTLLVAYGLPGVIFAVVALRFSEGRPWLRLNSWIMAAGFGAVWLALAIRHFWHGADISLPGVLPAEQYSYTIAMIVTGAALLYQAIASASSGLRRVAMSLIALTVAKVFLIDAADLAGLLRVFSFLALGLSLAGLAWLNRWAAKQAEEASG